MQRLSTASLPALADLAAVPTYDRSKVRPGIVHLGIGAFHRAHMAAYVDRLLGTTPEWGIVGASLRRPDTSNALAPQDFLYVLAVRGETTEYQVIGSVLDILDATSEHEKLLEIMTLPAIRIVSLTVTEKGYCHDPATGALDETHADIVHDLATPRAPVSAPGFLVEALWRRRQAGIAPFTVMSCDNLPSNGVTTARIVSRLAALRDAEFGAWVAANVAFPSTMVDRIVPATTDADRDAIGAALGIEDAWPIMTEPFTQWVIEDRFPSGRPAFETVGAQLVTDVEPFEKMKLRMLNGAHSSLAYLGYLAGKQYVSEVVADPVFRDFVHALMTEEAMPTLDMPGTDLGAYRDQLLQRFANPELGHRTWQIAMDGTQKLPQRLLGTIRDRLASGGSIDRLALGVAAWMRYVTGVDESGGVIEVKDPLSARLRTIADGAGRDAGRLVDGLLGVGEVFGDLAGNAVFRDSLVAHVERLWAVGARETVAGAR
ncbi:MAG: mannitol dehydrogenase [Devosia sp.]|nr:mannitol dehydrogenase [Devosia sp.]